MAKVKIYSTPTCPFCKRYKEFFKENNIEYEDINVASDHEAAHEMIEKTGQMSVPVLDIDGILIIGYDIDKTKNALKL